ncbi:MAG: class C sortase [Coriobacteriaceae bacterium]|nr:class C sortase [Olsenella sp.]RRF90762.1 MAG: class C sortase [Coriobacteriaceae bacterium]
MTMTEHEAALGVLPCVRRDVAPAKPKPRHRRGRLRRLVPVLGVALGLGLLAVPLALDLWEGLRAREAVSTMTDQAEAMDPKVRKELLAQARAYNHVLAGERTSIPTSRILPYGRQLMGEGQGVVSVIKIPSVGIDLPVRLGTSEEVLSSGAGHLEGSSLPVGGASTHVVLMGHSGLLGSRMFDDIRRLRRGDSFYLWTLGKRMRYEVVQTRVVLPEEVKHLEIKRGSDLCTLVTCTPYGINDHRLLVTGRRVCDDGGEGRSSVNGALSVPPYRMLILATGATLAAVGWLSHRKARGRRTASPPRHMSASGASPRAPGRPSGRRLQRS